MPAGVRGKHSRLGGVGALKIWDEVAPHIPPPPMATGLQPTYSAAQSTKETEHTHHILEMKQWVQFIFAMLSQ